MKYRAYLLNLTLILTTAVSTYFITPLLSQNNDIVSAQQAAAPQAKADNEYQAGAVLYMQKAAEYRALAYQAYNAAKMTLDADDKTKKKLPKIERKKARAVMVDIDETMLDNSPSQALDIKNRSPFTLPSWYAWGDKRKAKAVPGAVDFAKYAQQKGVKVFFVSNRDEVQKTATMDNLKIAGFPDVTAENVLLRQPNQESSKESRRAIILKNYRIVLFAGDNLDDMSNVFERKSIADRFAEVDKVQTWWGTKYIALPNAMYGTWESAIYEYARLTDAQKTEKRANALELP